MKQCAYISATVFVVWLSSGAFVTGQAQQELKGCICAVEDVAGRVTVRILPWEAAKTDYILGAEKTFTCDPTTVIEGETSATVGELKAGKTVQSAHLIGMTARGLASTPFEIESLPQLVGRRTTLTWVEDRGTLRATTIRLDYLFAGEDLAAIGGPGGAAVQGSDNCPCRAANK